MFRQLNSGLFVIRRSDRLWAGLPSDLVIEQVLMRSLKTNGGLTRGRGMEETQRLRWLLAMPACAEVSEVMQELTLPMWRIPKDVSRHGVELESFHHRQPLPGCPQV